MRDLRILLLIVITVLGDVSRAGPHQRRDEQLHCATECDRRFKEDPDTFSELLPGPKYCKGMKVLVACWKVSCIKKDEIAAINKIVEIYRNAFKKYYPHYKCDFLSDDKMVVIKIL